MSSLIQSYIASIQAEFDTQQSTEHSFRSALKTLLESIDPSILALNESQRITGVGMPDFTIKDKKNNTINIGWIEAKDLYVDLDEKKNTDQLGRYLKAFDNFIYTNNLTFHFYRNGKKVDTVTLGSCDRKTITWTTSDLFADNVLKLHRLLVDFLAYSGQTITSPEKLARAMAQKAQLIKYAIENIFAEEGQNAGLYNQFLSFKDLLVHDLTEGQFADMYAQTIAYGLFAARLYDPTLPTFSREEAEKLIPKSTPFIRWLFKQLASDDQFDDRVVHIVDDLVHIFLHCDVATILKTYGRGTQMQDPIIHFYETFLGEYDATMRKKRGVYYTPDPVVKFIVRGVDHLLKTEFGLTRGIADTSKIEHTFTEQGKKIKKQVHRVQLLDPATGTGTFLNETIKYIHANYFAGQDGIWEGYVGADLLPRIRGFEILMASYTMAHLKLGLTLVETGWTGDDRVNVFLTNSLEEPHDHIGSLFSQQLAKESEEASKVKKEQPIMIVMGNPPYHENSMNKGKFILSLIDDYKKDLNEDNIKPLSNDYVKFIRYGQHFIEKNKEGVLAFVTSNTYLDGIVFKKMRKSLLDTFDKIYILNLRGSTTKNDKAPDGSKDENVFDIETGVSVILGIKTGRKSKSKSVYFYDLYGTRETKYSFLVANQVDNIPWEQIEPVHDDYCFVKYNQILDLNWKHGISLSHLFQEFTNGFLTKRDAVTIHFDINSANNLKSDFISLSQEMLEKKYSIGIDSRDWKLNNAIQDLKLGSVLPSKVLYRAFDSRHTFYSGKIKGFMAYPNNNIFRHFLQNNIGLISQRQTYGHEFHHVFLTDTQSDQNVISNLGGGSVFPLYLYNIDLNGTTTKNPNLNLTLIEKICKNLGVTFIPDGDCSSRPDRQKQKIISPEDIFDYIYAVLHSPTYREIYKEFLKIDFPRVPFVKDTKVFWQLVEKGYELRLWHLMEHPQSDALITTYPMSGDNIVKKPTYEANGNSLGKVMVNEKQYIDNVPLIAWNFYVGGYQPAQKRLKDRKDRVLSYEDIMHYQKIIVALTNTARVMDEINIIRLD